MSECVSKSDVAETELVVLRDQIDKQLVVLNYVGSNSSLEQSRVRKRLSAPRISKSARELIEKHMGHINLKSYAKAKFLWERTNLPEEKLELEHPYPRARMVEDILTKNMNEQEVFDMLWDNRPILVTGEEHKNLPKGMPDCWDGVNNLVRYNNSGIEIQDNDLKF